MAGDVAYVSVIQWSESTGEEARVEGIVRAVGLDPFLAQQALKRGVPQVIAAIPAEGAGAAVAALHRAGAVAMAPTRSAMRAMSGVVRARRLAEGGETATAGGLAYAVEAWRGEGLSFRVADLFLMVRASLRDSITRARPDLAEDLVHEVTRTYGATASLGAAAAAAQPSGPLGVPRTTRTSLTEVLDLHLRDGRRVRLSGDKFNFDVLGAERGYSDRENMDRLALRIAERAPRAIVDTAFDRFRCPPDIVRDHRPPLGDGSVRRATDLPVFEFYSTWTCLVYRAMTGG
jgi:hypothetical protein